MELINSNVQESESSSIINQTIQLGTIVSTFNDATLNITDTQPSLTVSEQCRKFFKTLDPKIIEESFNTNKCLSISGDDIVSAILMEASEFFLKAVLNYFAQYELIKKGYITWAKVTNYYSSFFSVNSLLRLQLKLFTKIWNNNLFTIFFNPQSKTFYLKKNKFNNANHRMIWQRYYQVYDNFSLNDARYEPIYKKKYLDTDFSDEIDLRNAINYKPYGGFQEIWNVNDIHKHISDYRILCNEIKEVVDDLKSLCTDPNYKYCARSGLRLLFILKIFGSIENVDHFLNGVLKEQLKTFYKTFHQETDNNSIENKIMNFVIN
ncbi:MAG: hypothetical protein JW866_09760 [Ignavibacteriales bacterium]|nr:hypothetical protein [Ignavibacteriales bacterium]